MYSFGGYSCHVYDENGTELYVQSDPQPPITSLRDWYRSYVTEAPRKERWLLAASAFFGVIAIPVFVGFLAYLVMTAEHYMGYDGRVPVSVEILAVSLLVVACAVLTAGPTLYERLKTARNKRYYGSK